MNLQRLVAGLLAAAGVAALSIAIAFERRMHRHRQPGVSYRSATFRKDGGWRRSDLFTLVGLQYQRRASVWGVSGTLLLVASVVAWVVLGIRDTSSAVEFRTRAERVAQDTAARAWRHEVGVDSVLFRGDTAVVWVSPRNWMATDAPQAGVAVAPDQRITAIQWVLGG